MAGNTRKLAVNVASQVRQARKQEKPAVPAYRAQVDQMVAEFKRNAEGRINANIGNRLTDEAGTGLYFTTINPVDQLAAAIEAAVLASVAAK